MFNTYSEPTKMESELGKMHSETLDSMSVASNPTYETTKMDSEMLNMYSEFFNTVSETEKSMSEMLDTMSEMSRTVADLHPVASSRRCGWSSESLI